LNYVRALYAALPRRGLATRALQSVPRSAGPGRQAQF